MYRCPLGRALEFSWYPKDNTISTQKKLTGFQGNKMPGPLIRLICQLCNKCETIDNTYIGLSLIKPLIKLNADL